MEMQRIKAMFNDDSAVSPVIGVILMVAITVILAAVIASFVLGLGDQGDPAPTPTIDSSLENDNLTLDVTGGDDFDAGVASVQGTVGGSEVDFDLNADNAALDEVTAGTTITINTSRALINNEDVISGNLGSDRAVEDNPGNPIDEWEIEIVWNPADSDSQIIYSDSS